MLVAALFLGAIAGGAAFAYLWTHPSSRPHRDEVILAPLGTFVAYAVTHVLWYMRVPLYALNATGLVSRARPFRPPRELPWATITWFSVPPDRSKCYLSLASGKVEKLTLMPLSTRARDRLISAIDSHVARSR